MYIFLFNDFSNSVFVKMLSLHLQVTMDVYEKFNIFISIPKYSQRLILDKWISKILIWSIFALDTIYF